VHYIHADTNGREAFLALAHNPRLPGRMSAHEADGLCRSAMGYATVVKAGQSIAAGDATLLHDALAALAAWGHEADVSTIDQRFLEAVALAAHGRPSMPLMRRA